MTDGLDLPRRYREQLETLLREHVPGVEVWAYGSRVNGRGHEASDLDIVLRGPALEPLGDGFFDLLEGIENSNIPILVQAHDWARLPESFHHVIEQDYVVVQPAANRASEEGWLYHPDFPAHWDRRPLHSLAQWVNGLAFRNIQFSPTGKPVIKIAEIKGGISGQTKFTNQNFDESVRVRSGDLLFSWSGQPETSINAFWWKGPEGWLNQHIFRVTADPDVGTTFFYYLLRYLKPNFVGIARNKQTTGLGHVTKRDLENMMVSLPPLPEQRAIAHVLGTLDDKIELNRRMNETLEEMARALFESWFVDFEPVRAKMEGRLSAGQTGWRRGEALPGLPADHYDLFPDRLVDSELGKTPEGWSVKPLGEICHKPQYGYSQSAKDEPVGPKFLRITDINKAPWVEWESVPHCDIADEDYEKYRLKVGDVLIARMADPGHGCMIEEEHSAVFASYLIRFRPTNRRYARFIQYWLRSDNYWELVTGRGAGTTRISLNAKVLADFPILVPTDSLLDAFGERVSGLRSRIVANAGESRGLAAQRDTLLPRLISGKGRLGRRALPEGD